MDERGVVAEYLKLPEVARRLDISEKTARRMVKGGKLPAVFIGNAYRVSEEDLATYLRNAQVDPKAPGRSSVEPSFNDILAEMERPVVKPSAATMHIQTTATAKMLVEVLEDIEEGRIDEAAAKLRQLIAAAA